MEKPAPRSLEQTLIRAEEKQKRIKRIAQLLKRRDDLDTEIDSLKIQNELDSVNTAIENAEVVITPFIKTDSNITLSSETELNFILSEDDKTELCERIYDYYGIDIPPDSDIKTFGDLVYIMGKLK